MDRLITFACPICSRLRAANFPISLYARFLSRKLSFRDGSSNADAKLRWTAASKSAAKSGDRDPAGERSSSFRRDRFRLKRKAARCARAAAQLIDHAAEFERPLLRPEGRGRRDIGAIAELLSQRGISALAS